MRRTSPSPEIATLRARAAAYSRWANEPDTRGATAAMRATFMRSFYDQTPADLPEDVRLAMAERARRAHYAKLGLKSAIARRAKRDARRLATEPTEATEQRRRKPRRQRAEPMPPAGSTASDACLESFQDTETT